MHPPPSGEPRELSAAELAESSGDYFATELDVVFLVRVEEDHLRVGPEGWMRPMMATSEADLFSGGRGWTQIRFQRDGSGFVTGFVMDIVRVSGLIMERVPDSELRYRRRNQGIALQMSALGSLARGRPTHFGLS